MKNTQMWKREREREDETETCVSSKSGTSNAGRHETKNSDVAAAAAASCCYYHFLPTTCILVSFLKTTVKY